MPELPEVESARAAIEQAALHRRIVDVDDTDTYVCRPHHLGEIRGALVGREFTAAHRQGKSMWLDTSGVDGSDVDGSDAVGPELALHLGMSGRIVITGPQGETEGGDYQGANMASTRHPKNPAWNRFTVTFADGGQLRLLDRRRLGRVRLEASRDSLGVDAEQITLAQFRDRVGSGTAAVKAHLLDQSRIAGVGNLLADEALWQARIDPRRPSGKIDDEELARLRRALRAATRRARRLGGVHTGQFVKYRQREGDCPRCGAELGRATVGGRTTYWCPREQV